MNKAFTDTVPAPRIPIWFQLSLATMVVLAVSIGILSYVIMERQRSNLYDHIVKLGSVSLSYVADNAKVPLLTDDALALSTLINNVASVDGHFYALIVDTGGQIKAHTNHEMIGKQFEPFKNEDERVRQGAVTYFNHRLPDDSPVLNLSMAILFQEKQLGEVHVGLSIDFIRELFVVERAFIALATLIIIFLGMIAAVIYSLRFTRPLSALVHATSQIARGNYEYKVDSSRNDELGTLGEAFNRMSGELSRQAMIRESFGKYVGPEVLDLITKSPGQAWLKGQRSEASILFADIRGFTAYAEGREPEQVVEKLNEFFAIATEVIFRHGGYVDKFIGDSVLAVFGIPVTRRDHLERGIQAAVDMQRELAQASGAENPLLQAVGIGIASGIVVAGNIGSPVKMEYTVIGDSVNVASSLNNLAGPGEIIIGSDSGDDLGDIAEVEPLPPQKIKNRERLVQVFRVIKTICCLLPLLPALFGCAGLVGEDVTGPDGADLDDGVIPFPVSAQLQAIRAEEAARYHDALLYWRQVDGVVSGKIAAISEQLLEIAENHAQRGIGLFEQKKGDEAGRAFIEALKFDPTNRVALDYLKNRYQAERSLPYTVREGETFATIAEAAYGSSSYAFAVTYFSDAGREEDLVPEKAISLVDLESFSSQVLRNYKREIQGARQLFAEKQYEKVLPVARAILGDHPGDEEASYIFNRSLLNLARQQREEQQFEQAIETLSRVNPHFKNVKELILEIREEQKENLDGSKILANAALFRQGERLATQGRHLEALTAFLQVDSTHDGVQQAIAEVKAELKIKAEGHFKEGVRFFVEENLTAAISEWEKTLLFDPSHTNAVHSLEKARALLERVKSIR